MSFSFLLTVVSAGSLPASPLRPGPAPAAPSASPAFPPSPVFRAGTAASSPPPDFRPREGLREPAGNLLREFPRAALPFKRPHLPRPFRSARYPRLRLPPLAPRRASPALLPGPPVPAKARADKSSSESRILTARNYAFNVIRPGIRSFRQRSPSARTAESPLRSDNKQTQGRTSCEPFSVFLQQPYWPRWPFRPDARG